MLGPYEIVCLHRKGGMGEVYRAKDARLGREVALKVLRADGNTDPVRLRRFQQEARAASALKHPAIVVVHETGSDKGPPTSGLVHYIAMELVEGEPLDEILRRRRLDIEQCLEMAAPLADGLARAHEANIIHRDFKPSNVIVGGKNQPKILDFGLAKMTLVNGASSSEMTMTSEGAVMGTVGYMSPEQARGETVTAASDQFSFGCVLYEMLTGKRAFQRPSTAETIAAILREEPPPLEDSVPEASLLLRWIVTRCLAKDPTERYAATRDLARDLDGLRVHGAGRSVPASDDRRSRRQSVWWLALAAIPAVLIAGAWTALQYFREPPPEPLFRPLTFRSGFASRALFVPGSNAILYTASWDGQPVRTYQTLPETLGSDRTLDSEVQFPLTYSGDASQVLVLLGVPRSGTVLRGTLAWWPALGGKARPVIEDVGWADWSTPAQQFAVVRDTGTERILEIRDATGALVRLLHRTTGAITSVRFAPDGKRVAFGRHASPWDPAGEIWTATTDGAQAAAVTPIFEQCRGLAWNRATGEIWFAGSRTSGLSNGIWATDGPGSLRSVMPLPQIFVLHDISADGTRMLLERDGREAHLAIRRAGEVPRTLNWFGWSVVSDLSPDGRSLLFYDRAAAATTVGTWLRPLDGGDAIRLGDGVEGAFSPDGRSVVTVVTDGSSPPQLVLTPVGAGERRMLTAPPAAYGSPSFMSPSTLLFVRTEGGSQDVWRMEIDGSGARSLGATGCDSPTASLAGDRFVCVGGASRREIIVRRFDRATANRLFERADGGRFIYARWDRTGARVFAVATDRRLFSIHADTGAVLHQETLPYPGAGPYDPVIGVALDADAATQSYSVRRQVSDLYEVSQLR
jgi:serine/threonine protein kinase